MAETPSGPITEELPIVFPPEKERAYAETESSGAGPRHQAERGETDRSADEPNKICSPTEQNFVPVAAPAPEQKNAPILTKTIPPRELFEPAGPAPQVPAAPYKKIGKVGRKRRYEQVGNDGVLPVRDVVFYRKKRGCYWPGMSKDMRDYYEFWYFTKPKRKEGETYDRHLAAWERAQRWLAAGEGTESVGSGSEEDEAP